MDSYAFARTYPTLFHMADESAWPSIQRHGLLGTQAIVDLYDPPAETRSNILNRRRLASYTLHSTDLGSITVRDQLPLKFLAECLSPGVTPQAFLDALNGRVFFWLSESRLQRLLNAKAYRDRRHLILHLDTAALLDAYGAVVELAPYNTGSAHVPNVPKRGPETFVPLADYPFEYWRRKRGRNGEHVVELTVPHSVPDTVRFLRRVELRERDRPPVEFAGA